jgi:hypothetical protein
MHKWIAINTKYEHNQLPLKDPTTLPDAILISLVNKKIIPPSAPCLICNFLFKMVVECNSLCSFSVFKNTFKHVPWLNRNSLHLSRLVYIYVHSFILLRVFLLTLNFLERIKIKIKYFINGNFSTEVWDS